MTKDRTREVTPGAPAEKMDRRSFLLALSGGALALTAPGLLTGCGGGGGGGNSGNGPGSSGSSSSSSSSSASGSAVPVNGRIPFPTGQSGALALTVGPSGQASGTLTVGAVGGVRPRTPGVTIPPGTYAITGMVNTATGAFNLGTTVPGTGAGTGALTLSGTLPTATAAGTYTFDIAGPPDVNGSGAIPAGAFTPGTGGAVNFTTTVGPTPGSSTLTRTSLLQNGTEIAYVDAPAGYPNFVLTAVGGNAPIAVPSAATMPSGKTLVSPYVIGLALVGTLTNPSAELQATLSLHYTGTHTGELAYLSNGTVPFTQAPSGTIGLGLQNNIEAVVASFESNADSSQTTGGLKTAYSSLTGSTPAGPFGTTVYVGLFA